MKTFEGNLVSKFIKKGNLPKNLRTTVVYGTIPEGKKSLLKKTVRVSVIFK